MVHTNVSFYFIKFTKLKLQTEHERKCNVIFSSLYMCVCKNTQPITQLGRFISIDFGVCTHALAIFNVKISQYFLLTVIDIDAIRYNFRCTFLSSQQFLFRLTFGQLGSTIYMYIRFTISTSKSLPCVTCQITSSNNIE